MTYQLALERGELVGVVDTADTEPGENPALRRSSVLVKACRVVAVYWSIPPMTASRSQRATKQRCRRKSFVKRSFRIHSERLTARGR